MKRVSNTTICQLEFEQKLNSIETKLKKVNDAKNDLNYIEKELYDQRYKLLKKRYLVVYRILCKPDRSDHLTHEIGSFSTPEKAQQLIPSEKCSYNMCSKCTWYYYVKSTKPTEHLLLTLDSGNNIPSHFPYS